MSINAFKLMMKSSRESNVKKPAAKRTKNEISGGNFWKKGLTEALKDPENVVDSTDSLVVLKDKYPKVLF